MWIEKLILNNFRNYGKQEIVLNKNMNIFYGENAQGKTNVIESIFLSSIGKSFRTNKDSEMITTMDMDVLKDLKNSDIKEYK